MKRKISWCIALFALLFMAPAWSHHPAESIISYDVWQMIDDNLAEVSKSGCYRVLTARRSIVLGLTKVPGERGGHLIYTN